MKVLTSSDVRTAVKAAGPNTTDAIAPAPTKLESAIAKAPAELAMPQVRDALRLPTFAYARPRLVNTLAPNREDMIATPERSGKMVEVRRINKDMDLDRAPL